MTCRRRSFLQRLPYRLVAIPALLLFSAAQACEGCFDDWFAPYLQRYDGVTVSAGNAKEQNAISEYMDSASASGGRKGGRRAVPGVNGQNTVAGFGGPLPPYVLNRGLPLNGQRAVGAMERYRDATKYYGFSKVPLPGSASTTPPPPANGTVTGGTQQ